MVAEVTKLLQDSKNNFVALAELACKHSAQSDTLRQLRLQLDCSHDRNKTNNRIEKFINSAKGAGSYKGKIAAGNKKLVRDLVRAQ